MGYIVSCNSAFTGYPVLVHIICMFNIRDGVKTIITLYTIVTKYINIEDFIIYSCEGIL